MFYNGYFTSWYRWYYGLETLPDQAPASPSVDTVEVKPESRPNSPVPSIAQLETEQETVARPKRFKFSRP